MGNVRFLQSLGGFRHALMELNESSVVAQKRSPDEYEAARHTQQASQAEPATRQPEPAGDRHHTQPAGQALDGTALRPGKASSDGWGAQPRARSRLNAALISNGWDCCDAPTPDKVILVTVASDRSGQFGERLADSQSGRDVDGG
jgi:hypothetical protein